MYTACNTLSEFTLSISACQAPWAPKERYMLTPTKERRQAHSCQCFWPWVYCACMLSCVWLFATLWSVNRQAPLSMRFSRQEYWSGLPFPPPGDLPDPEIEPMSPDSPAGEVGRVFHHWATWEDSPEYGPLRKYAQECFRTTSLLTLDRPFATHKSPVTTHIYVSLMQTLLWLWAPLQGSYFSMWWLHHPSCFDFPVLPSQHKSSTLTTVGKWVVREFTHTCLCLGPEVTQVTSSCSPWTRTTHKFPA